MTTHLSKMLCRVLIANAIPALLFGLEERSIASAQGLQITSPSAGTVVGLGASVTVVLTPTSGVTVSGALVAAEDPIGFSSPVSTPPFNIGVTIPSNAKPGIYHLTALGAATDGSYLSSSPVTIDVEPTGTVTSLQILPGIINFNFPGDQLPLAVVGSLSTGDSTILTYSTLIQYSSSNTAVAQVSAGGIVTAVGPGTATITVSGPASPFIIPVFVSKSTRGDLNGDGRIDMDDVNILRAALNIVCVGSLDARDLNGDGIIDAEDVRVLMTLCTYQACASQP